MCGARVVPESRFAAIPRRHPPMDAIQGLPAGLIGAFIANSVLFFIPTYVLHTVCYPLLQSRRIRYDLQSHASVTISTLFAMDEQLRREWKNAMQVAVGGLGTVILEKALVEMQVLEALPVSTPIEWSLITRQYLIYFVLFDCYYYFLHRFFFHSSWGWKIHKVHHDSHVCYPSTGFSFHWFEGVVTGGFNPFLAHCLRFDQRIIMVCQLYGILNTVFVHAGIQIVPTWWDKRWLSKWYLSSQFHEVHHHKVGCNYGGFTTLYDHLFGTVYHKYDDMVNRLAAHIELVAPH
jgi:sterol desaturase/sphingolipid hydroxylase (fatty acid hydroxylase superfamily)